MVTPETLQAVIRSQLRQEGPCTLESLLDRLPQFSWSQIFTVVDQLSREGELVLRHPARFGYELSMGSAMTISDHGGPVVRPPEE
jgi:hypothetical protein